MLTRIRELPFLVTLIGLGALAMIGPMLHALATGDEATARDFFYSAVITLIATTMLALATATQQPRREARSYLVTLLAFYLAVPAVLAMPYAMASGDNGYGNAYLDMVAALTTTGGDFLKWSEVPASVHLWRAEVGWLGGFFVWVTAVAIFEPLNLGGFEITAATGAGQGTTSQITRVAAISERLTRFAWQFFPAYAGLTAVLWLVLIIVGDPPLIAICHAMSTLSVSGISPIGGPAGAPSGIGGEMLIFLFFLFALSRTTFSQEERPDGLRSVFGDAELRMGLGIVFVLPALLFLRHFIAAIDGNAATGFVDGVVGLWGAVFTTASFLTTTGFESAVWGSARIWSGLDTPGIILLGLATFGGGVATAAGGVKLLRIFALYKQGLREMEKLVHPSSVGGSGQAARRFRRRGAYVAWIFFMLFAVSIAAVMTALSATGLDFETVTILALAALTNTGPLATSAAEIPIDLLALAPIAKAILVAAMIVGRLEVLAIIALLNPEFWRK